MGGRERTSMKLIQPFFNLEKLECYSSSLAHEVLADLFHKASEGPKQVPCSRAVSSQVWLPHTNEVYA